ncbi:HAD family hydrolase [Pimelobacter simplex]|uniref:HAD family hydrolase n=1 Tax=Nocardioides simplex TaxID=2045 RepID=A0A7J5DZD4_NOCSI|nr:HAD family hydrolase [Pimelobacter simplex]KAB2811386.1 HAD family hydrolase [Pimelobacter simplex]
MSLLVATDLDGTLLPYDSATVPSYTAEVLRRADEAGIPIVFVTARPLRWMEPLWPYVGRHGRAIVSNGAITYDVHRRAPITVAGIEPGPGLELVAAIAESVPGASFAVECLDGIRQDPQWEEPYHLPAGAVRGPLADVWDLTAVKLLVRAPGSSPEALREGVVAAVGERATPTWSVPGLMEISATGVTKASALVALCEGLGVGAEDVVAFGDMPNDIPMLAWAGTSYAMADAHESVREVARHVAPACADEGVAQVLDRLLTQRS